MARADERRSAYRLRYPDRAMPAFEAEHAVLRVLDVSERGLRYECPAGEAAPETGQVIAGVLRMHQARTVDVQAVVERVHGRTVSCRLASPGISLNVMFAEQRWLLRRYPLLFRAAG